MFPKFKGVNWRGSSITELTQLILALIVSAMAYYFYWSGLHAASNKVIGWSLLGIAAVALARAFSLPTNQTLAPKSLRESIGAGVIAALISTIALWNLFSGSGTPAFQHDWLWPPDRVSAEFLYSFIRSNWQTSGIGLPKAFPTLYPIYAAITATSWLAGAHGSFVLLSLFLTILTASGFYLCARLYVGLAAIPAFVSAMAFSFSPFVVDKYGAGHIHILLAYAMLPWFGVTLALGEIFVSRAATFALIIGLAVAASLSACALDCLPYSLIVLTILPAALRRPLRAYRIVLSALLLGMLCHVQSLYHLMFALQPSQVGPITTKWLIELSATPTQLLSLLHYIGGYARREMPLGGFPQLFIAFPAFGIFVISIAAIFGTRRDLVFVAVWIAGIVLGTGLLDPFSEQKRFLFSHFFAFNVLREFYNATMLITLATAVAFGRALQTCWERRPLRLIIVPIVAVAVTTVRPYVGGLSQEIRVWSEPDSTRLIAGLLTHSEGERVALLPIIGPLAYGETSQGGTDAYFTGFFGHPTMYEALPEPLFGLAGLMYERGERIDDANRLLGYAGVKWIVDRHDIRSVLPTYWYPHLFPPSWGTHAASLALKTSRSARQVFATSEFTVFENRLAVPMISFGSRPAKCNENILLSMSKGICLKTAGLDQPRQLREVVLKPSTVSYDTNNAWVAPASLFMAGYGIAATSRGIVTASRAHQYLSTMIPTASAMYVKCAASKGIAIRFSGEPGSRPICKGNLDEAARWFVIPGITPGSKRFTATSLGGVALIERVVFAPAGSLAVLKATEVENLVVPMKIGLPAEALSFHRSSATRFAGRYNLPNANTMLVSERFDPRWQLYLDGTRVIQSTKVNDFENAFPAPGGAHSFEVRFDPGLLDESLGYTEGATWLILLIALAIVASYRFGIFLKAA